MFTNLDFKITFILNITVSIAPTARILLKSPESNILGEKTYDLISDVKIIFVKTSISYEEPLFLSNLKQITSQEWHGNKNIPFGAFWTLMSGVYKLSRNNLIRESIKFGGKLFFKRVFKWSISKWNVLKSRHMPKLLWSNVYESPIFGMLTLVTNVPFLQQILRSRNESKSISSCSTLKFMSWCLEDIYSQNERADSGDSKSKYMSFAYLL